jgi:hypothetical protein
MGQRIWLHREKVGGRGLRRQHGEKKPVSRKLKHFLVCSGSRGKEGKLWQGHLVRHNGDTSFRLAGPCCNSGKQSV